MIAELAPFQTHTYYALQYKTVNISPAHNTTGAECECCPPTAVTSYFTNFNDPFMNPLYTELDNQDTIIHTSPTFMDLSLHLLSTVRCLASTPRVPRIMI